MAGQKVVGIDLGTTYSCVAVWKDDRIEVIPNEQGNRTTPSMVAFTAHGRLMGEAAKHQIANNPYNTVFDAKRLIGRRYTDPSVQSDLGFWPFKVVASQEKHQDQDQQDQPLIEVTYLRETRRFTPEEISAMVLTKMKKTAEDYLGAPVNGAVVTIPAYFNDSQRKATRDAATIAGLHVVRMITEPSAAAIAYGLHPHVLLPELEKTVLVFDLGGGTLDISVLKIQKGEFIVKAVDGDMHLGGEDFDNRLLGFCVDKFNAMHGNSVRPDITSNPKALRRLRAECQKAKCILSDAMQTIIEIDYLHKGLDFTVTVSRARFEELNAVMFTKCVDIVDRCVTGANMNKHDIDEILLVGGSTRIPRVQWLLQSYFEGKPLCRALNPDEAVATGAALLGASMNGERGNFVLVDVTPLTLGIEVNHGVMHVMIPKNSPIPARGEKSVSTLYDYQPAASFKVFEGERALVADNYFLGEVVLCGIQPAKRGIPDLRVLFEVESDGILRVSAKDTLTGLSSRIVIRNDGGRLRKAEIQKMLEEAEKFKAVDEKARLRHLAKNELHCYIQNMICRLTEMKELKTIDDGAALSLEGILREAEDWLDDNEFADTDEFNSQLVLLKRRCRRLSYERIIY